MNASSPKVDRSIGRAKNTPTKGLRVESLGQPGPTSTARRRTGAAPHPRHDEPPALLQRSRETGDASEVHQCGPRSWRAKSAIVTFGRLPISEEWKLVSLRSVRPIPASLVQDPPRV
mgnify:FL=1|jgi:hypothetical protein